MLYKFKSKSTGELIMLQPGGRRILQIIGKNAPSGSNDAPDRGIILPEQMAAAIEALQAAIAQETAERQAAVEAALESHLAPPRFEAVSLRQRAQPFIEMLKRCEKAGHEIVWGV